MFWDGFARGYVKGVLVGGLALIIGFLVFQTAQVLMLPLPVSGVFGFWAFLAAIAIGKP